MERSRMRAAAALLATLLAAPLATLLAGCGGPLLAIPGGALAGEPAAVPVSWGASHTGVLELETRPGDPYSVQVNYVVRDGRLYVDPADGRRWLEHLRASPLVRVRIDGRVYAMRAVLAGRPGELAGFDEDRWIYELVAR